MCGIAGILRFDGRATESERVRQALEVLRHRGPDGEGVYAEGPCTLIHTRLSIIDHTGGNQPMSADASAVIFNGMIYNHRELRAQLQRHGHRFTSDHSDTEVLLHGYRQWGTDLPARLEGMFAFAVWDSGGNSGGNYGGKTLFLCRDRMGKKPLYLRQTPSGFVFASLISGLRALEPEPWTINPHALQTFLRFGYTFEQSLIEGVSELPAAHWMSITSAGKVITQRYWRPPQRSTARQANLEDVRSTLDTAVRKRLEADVPLGCFLSGGIDSSLIAALAQQALRDQGNGPLQTFSVKMPEAGYDESPFARRVAAHIGSRHTELRAEPSRDVIGDLRALIRMTDEPTADSSLLPTFWLSKTAREHVKVALSGDGGDEIFGGYERYRAMQLLRRNAGWLRWVPKISSVVDRSYGLWTRLHRVQSAARNPTPASQYAHLVHLFTTEQLRELGLSVSLDKPFEAPDWTDALAWDQTHYLPFDLLRKVDRASMAVALEVRCPMLDTAMVELADRLPVQVLMPHGRPKGLLRQLARQLLPLDIARRPKQGFAIPIGRWFRGQLLTPLRDHLLNGQLNQIGFRQSAIEAMIRDHATSRADHTHRLFALLALSLWRS